MLSYPSANARRSRPGRVVRVESHMDVCLRSRARTIIGDDDFDCRNLSVPSGLFDGRAPSYRVPHLAGIDAQPRIDSADVPRQPRINACGSDQTRIAELVPRSAATTIGRLADSRDDVRGSRPTDSARVDELGQQVRLIGITTNERREVAVRHIGPNFGAIARPAKESVDRTCDGQSGHECV